MLLLLSLVTNATLENYSWAVGHGETLPKKLYIKVEIFTNYYQPNYLQHQ